MPRKPKAEVEPKPVQFNDPVDYIAHQIEQYQARNTLLQAIVDKGPQFKATPTGYPALIFETCSCGTYADRRKDHAADCKVQAVTDPMPIVAGLREMRLNDSRLDALRKMLPEEDQSEEVQSWISYIQDLDDQNKALTARCAHLERLLQKYETDLGDLRAVEAEVIP